MNFLLLQLGWCWREWSYDLKLSNYLAVWCKIINCCTCASRTNGNIYRWWTVVNTWPGPGAGGRRDAIMAIIGEQCEHTFRSLVAAPPPALCTHQPLCTGQKMFQVNNEVCNLYFISCRTPDIKCGKFKNSTQVIKTDTTAHSLHCLLKQNIK